jgi:hypothetical protein
VENFPRIMDWRIAEAAHQDGAHGPHLDSLGTLLQTYRKTSPTKKPLKRSQILGLLGVMAEHYQDEGPEVTIVVRGAKVITVGVVDYVLKRLKPPAIAKLVRATELRIPRIPSLERWPKEVKIGRQVYLRGDLAYRPGEPPPLIHPATAPTPEAVTLEEVVANKVKAVKIKVGKNGFRRMAVRHDHRKVGQRAIPGLRRKTREKPIPTSKN